MLKDITLGQFFPGNSPLHRLDPRAKIIVTFAYIIALFIAKGPICYGIMLTFLIFSVAISSISPKTLLRGMKPLVFIITFTGILNIFYAPGEKVLYHWAFITITFEGIATAFFMILRILMLVSGTFLLTYTTSPMMLTDAIEQLLGPLKHLRVPVHELTMMMTIALRFIPTLIEETDKIMSAQRARGADFETGNIIRRAKALIPLLVPLFVSAFRRAADLALAMESRCYHGGEGRTRLRSLQYTAFDIVTMSATGLLFAGVIVLAILL